MKSKFNSQLLVLFAATLALSLLTACETEEDRTLAEAEACINRATAATVDACVAKVAGMTNEDAYLIRCSAHFIAQNITEASLTTGFANIKSATSGGVPSMTYAMSYLLFDNSITNHTISTAMNNCSLSGATSLYKLVQLSNLGTTLGGGAIANGDSAGLAAAIAGFGGDAAAVGNMVLDIKTTFCDNGGSFGGTDICTKVNLAVTNAGGNATTIGNLIADYLDNM